MSHQVWKHGTNAQRYCAPDGTTYADLEELVGEKQALGERLKKLESRVNALTDELDELRRREIA